MMIPRMVFMSQFLACFLMRSSIQFPPNFPKFETPKNHDFPWIGQRRPPRKDPVPWRTVYARLSNDNFVKSPDASLKLHLSPAFAGAGLLRRTPKYASLLGFRAPCRSLSRRRPGAFLRSRPQFKAFYDFLRERQ